MATVTIDEVLGILKTLAKAQRKTEVAQQKTEAGFQMLQEEQKKTEVAQQKN